VKAPPESQMQREAWQWGLQAGSVALAVSANGREAITRVDAGGTSGASPAGATAIDVGLVAVLDFISAVCSLSGCTPCPAPASDSAPAALQPLWAYASGEQLWELAEHTHHRSPSDPVRANQTRLPALVRAVRDAKPQDAPPRLDQRMFLWASYVVGQDRN
jgi:hypothetical protein